MALAGDLAEPSASEELVAAASDSLGPLDILVCNHAHGGDAVSIRDATAEAYDRHWAVNTRATLLMTQAFAARHDGRPGGRVIWMTSGQQLGPMSDNLAYAVSKAALAGATSSVAADLAASRILLNTINPDPSTPATSTTLLRNFSSTSLLGDLESRTILPASSPGWCLTPVPGLLVKCSTPRAGSSGKKPGVTTATTRTSEHRASIGERLRVCRWWNGQR